MYCHKRCLENNDIFKWRGGGESDPFYNCPARSYFSFSLYHAGEQNALATPKIFISCYFQCLKVGRTVSRLFTILLGSYSDNWSIRYILLSPGFPCFMSWPRFCLNLSWVIWDVGDEGINQLWIAGITSRARELPQNIEVRNSAGTSWRL